MKRRVLGSIGVGLALVALLVAWVVSRPGPPPVPGSSLPPSVGSSAAPRLDPSAPSGRVVRAGDRSPVAGAEVLALLDDQRPYPRCAVCRRGFRWCNAPESVQRTLRELREGQLTRVPVLARTVTAADGTFTLPPQPAGVRLLVRSSEGFADQEEITGPDLELEVVKAPRLRVVDEQGTPIAGAEVVVYTDADGEHRTLTSDAEGQLALRATELWAWLGTETPGYLPTALLTVEAETTQLQLSRPKTLLIKTVQDGRPVDADVWVTQRTHERLVHASGGSARVEGLSFEPVELRASSATSNSKLVTLPLTNATTEVVLTLEPGAVLALTVLGSGGGSGAMVSLWPRARGLTGGETAFVRAGGSVTLGPVEVGSWDLDLEARGQPKVHRELELHAGRNELTLSLNDGLEVSGVVVDDLDQPVPGVMVSVQGSRNNASFTNPRGEFGLGIEKPGQVTLELYDQARTAVTREVAAPAANVRVVIPRPAQVVFEVRSPDGRPVRGTITLLQEEVFKEQVALTNQLVSKPLTISPGHYRVEARFDERPEHRQAFDVAAADERRVVIELGAGAGLSGRVVSRGGSRVPNADVVALCGVEFDSYAETRTDAQGAFALEGLVAGSCTLMISAPGSAEQEDFPVKAPARDLVLTLEQAGRAVHGRVLDEQGQPLDRVRCDDRPIPTEAGRFNLFTSAATLEFRADHYLPARVPVTADDLGDITLHPVPECRGVVVGADGAPVAGAELSLAWLTQAMAMPTGKTERDGAFHVALRDAQPTQVNAELGSRSGAAQCSPGADVRIVLRDEARVEGVFFEAPGRGGRVRVTAQSASAAGERTVMSEPSGRFGLSLAEGLWVIGTQPGLVTRTWRVPASAPLGLGSAPGNCTLRVRSPEPFLALWLLPPPATTPADFALLPGAARVSPARPLRELTVAGLPCGALQLMTESTRQPVVLTPPLTEVDLAGP